jgi:hypothetical protein
MANILFVLLFCAQIVQCAPGKKGKKGKRLEKAKKSNLVSPSVSLGNTPETASYPDQQSIKTAEYVCVECKALLVGKSFSCGSCKTTFYCSKECQETNWKNHKVQLFSNLKVKL